MKMFDNCERYMSDLREYTRDLHTRYVTRRISFFNRDIAESLYSLGYVETVIQQESSNGVNNGYNNNNNNNTTNNNNINTSSSCSSSSSNDEVIPTNEIIPTILNEEKYETLEMQLKQMPRRNATLSRKNKFSHNIPIKLTSKQRFKSIIEPRKFFQPYKIIGSEGEETSEFKHPLGVAVSPIDGCIYVADSWNNRIQVFDENGNYLKSIEKIGQIEFHYPYSIHIDRKGRIYVSDQSLIRIKVFDCHFNLIRVIGHYGREMGCYSGLCDISTDKENNIYVCDSGNHRILKFTESGEFIAQWGSNGSAEGLFKCPACVTVHEDKVMVSDWGNHRVQVFTLDGKFLNQIGKQGTGPGEFKRPLGVAVDEKGNIAIVDEGNNRLQIFKSDFSYHSKISGLKCDFQRPWDVAITKQGGIVVSEYYGHRLQIL